VVLVVGGGGGCFGVCECGNDFVNEWLFGELVFM